MVPDLADLQLFAIAAGATIVTGLVLRLAFLRDEESLTLEKVDLAGDLLAASAAVIPTLLISESRPVGRDQTVAIAVVIVFAFLWGKGDTRYFFAWRKGQVVPRDPENKKKRLDPVAAPHPRRMRAAAFSVSHMSGLLALLLVTGLTQSPGQ